MPFQKGNKLGEYNGNKWTKKQKERVSNKNSHKWKGEEVKYHGVHAWINKFAKINCQNCSSTKNLDWANKDHKYKRIEEDWICLCRSCHKKYDYIKGFIKKQFGRNPWNKGLKGEEYLKHYKNGVGRKKG